MTTPSPQPGPGSSTGDVEQNSPAAPAPSTGPATGSLGKDTLAALQAAMAAEHAALWAYGLVAAYDPDAADTVSTMLASHQNTRDVTANLIVQGGATPVGPAPAYTTPNPVTDPKSAMALALVIEQDCAAAWYAVIGNTDDSTVRGTALSTLTDAAMRMVTWRKAGGDKALTVPFPGSPSQT